MPPHWASSFHERSSYTDAQWNEIASMCKTYGVPGFEHDLMRENLTPEQARARLAELAAAVDRRGRQRDASDRIEGAAVDDWLIERLKKFGMDLSNDQIARFRAGYKKYRRMGRIKNEDIEEEPEHEPGDRGAGEFEWLLGHHVSSRW